MKSHFQIFVLLIVFLATSCSTIAQRGKKPIVLDIPEELEEYETAYFAAGCFWCVEAVFESITGVQEVISGYAGGKTENPTYNEVSSGSLKHAEAVKIYYDASEVTFQTLLKVFYGSHDPTALNYQGPDHGPQYRSIVFHKTEMEKSQTLKYIAALEASGEYDAKIVTEVVPFEKFYNAEAYHQNYEKNNPNNPYVRKVSIPRLRKFQDKYPELLKK